MYTNSSIIISIQIYIIFYQSTLPKQHTSELPLNSAYLVCFISKAHWKNEALHQAFLLNSSWRRPSLPRSSIIIVHLTWDSSDCLPSYQIFLSGFDRLHLCACPQICSLWSLKCFHTPSPSGEHVLVVSRPSVRRGGAHRTWPGVRCAE